MKKKLCAIYVILTLGLPYIPRAQNWDIFPPEQAATFQYFEPGRAGLTPLIHICYQKFPDSLSANATYKLAAPYSSVGTEVILARQDTLFFTPSVSAETYPLNMVYLLPKATVGQSWTIQETAGFWITIRCDSAHQGTYCGISDSLKYFHLEVHQHMAQPPHYPDTLRTYPIVTGKQYGLLVCPYFSKITDLKISGTVTIRSIKRNGNYYGVQWPKAEKFLNITPGNKYFWNYQYVNSNVWPAINKNYTVENTVTQVQTFGDSLQVVTYDSKRNDPSSPVILNGKKDSINLISIDSILDYGWCNGRVFSSAMVGDTSAWYGTNHPAVNMNIYPALFLDYNGFTVIEIYPNGTVEIGEGKGLSYFYNLTLPPSGSPINTKYTLDSAKLTITDITEPKSQDDYIVFPNPVVNSITLVCKQSFENNYCVLNTNGQVLMRGVFIKEKKLALDHLPAGFYVISLQGKNSTAIKKIIKQ